MHHMTATRPRISPIPEQAQAFARIAGCCLELLDGARRALAHEAEEGRQAPVITVLPRAGENETDRQDYDRETRPDPGGPEM